MKRIIWIVLGVILAILLVGILGFNIYVQTATYRPTAEALDAMQSDEAVIVHYDDFITFIPTATEPTTGFILYPGGLVDPGAYAPYARAIAEEGYLVVIPPMVFNLAVFSPNAAAGVIDEYEFIDDWYIGGHSLGGTMAALYANDNQELINGIAFWASYPADSDDLSNASFEQVSIYGTRDGLIPVSQIEETSRLLASDATFVEIEGGNHAQFGWYGPQDGDLEPEIAHEEQQAITVEAVLELMGSGE